MKFPLRGVWLLSRFTSALQCIAACCAWALSGSCAAQSTPDIAPRPAARLQSSAELAAQPVALTEHDLEIWLDGFMPYALQSGDVAGGVVVVVREGQVLLEKGYGYADVEKKIPVDPQRTLFRPGSISKLFTWTAVMQLVEQGKLDLDTDVNRYLDFTIPPFAGAPVTLRHLLTHTGGFEDTLKGAYSMDPADILPLEGYIKAWTPNRVYPPGAIPAYSNYGTALAGYIVQRVSEESFDDYVDRHILAPLGMHRTTSRQPLPERFQADMSKGYWSASGSPQPFEVYGPAPAGSFSATGSDMARFMIAHLQRGEYAGARILRSDTARLMHDTALTVLPAVNRMLLGFFESNRNGRRIIGHGGDTPLFHSVMHLFIDDGIGLFVSLNSSGREGAAYPIRTALFEQFTDRYLPGPKPDGQVDAQTAKAHAEMIAGSYVMSRRAHSSFLSLLGLFGRTEVVANEDGTISIADFTGVNGAPKKWREIAPFVWRDVDGAERLAAKPDGNRIAMFSVDEISPFVVFLPVPGSSGPWLASLLVIAVTALLLAVLQWPLAAAIRRGYRVAFPLEGQGARAYRIVRLACLAVLVTLAAWVLTILLLSQLTLPITTATDPWLWTLRVLGALVFVGAVPIVAWHARIVWVSGRSAFSKVWSVMLVLACLTVLWTAIVCHLISFSAGY